MRCDLLDSITAPTYDSVGLWLIRSAFDTFISYVRVSHIAAIHMGGGCRRAGDFNSGHHSKNRLCELRRLAQPFDA